MDSPSQKRPSGLNGSVTRPTPSKAKEDFDPKLTVLIDATFEDLRKLSSLEAINENERLKDIYYLEIDNK
jgi:hypothetical protein